MELSVVLVHTLKKQQECLRVNEIQDTSFEMIFMKKTQEKNIFSSCEIREGGGSIIEEKKERERERWGRANEVKSVANTL